MKELKLDKKAKKLRDTFRKLYHFNSEMDSDDLEEFIDFAEHSCPMDIRTFERCFPCPLGVTAKN